MKVDEKSSHLNSIAHAIYIIAYKIIASFRSHYKLIRFLTPFIGDTVRNFQLKESTLVL